MAIIVQLLIGEIPIRQTFYQTETRDSLKPYVRATAARISMAIVDCT